MRLSRQKKGTTSFEIKAPVFDPEQLQENDMKFFIKSAKQQAVCEKITELGLEGNVECLRFVAERTTLPPRVGSFFEFKLPTPRTTIEQVQICIGIVIDGMCTAQLSNKEGWDLIGSLKIEKEAMVERDIVVQGERIIRDNKVDK